MRIIAATNMALNINTMDLVRTCTKVIDRELSSNLDGVHKIFLSESGLLPYLPDPHSTYVLFDLVDGDRDLFLLGRVVDGSGPKQMIGKVFFTKDGEVIAGNVTDIISVEGIKLRYQDPKIALHLAAKHNVHALAKCGSRSVRNITAFCQDVHPKSYGTAILLTPSTVEAEDLTYSEAELLEAAEIDKLVIYLHYPEAGIIFKAKAARKVVDTDLFSHVNNDQEPAIKLYDCVVTSIIGPNGRHMYREGGTIPDLPMILKQDRDFVRGS